MSGKMKWKNHRPAGVYPDQVRALNPGIPYTVRPPRPRPVQLRVIPTQEVVARLIASRRIGGSP